MKNSTDKKKTAIGIFLGIVAGFLVIFLGIRYMMQPSFDSYLTSVSHEVNKQCPILVDRETRLDNSVVLPGKVFQYNYTLVNLDKSQVDVDEAQKTIAPNLISNIKSNPDMNEFRENKVKIIYSYRDKNGQFLFKILITPEMYNN